MWSGSATAVSFDFPDDPVLSDPTSRKLAFDDDYSLSVLGFDVDPGWTNSQGDTVTWEFEVSVLDPIALGSEFMLVFTSIRVGSATSITCSQLSPGGPLPFGSYSYVRDGPDTGDVIRQEAPTDSLIAGESQVCNAELSQGPLFGLVFAPETSEPLRFSFQIETTEDNIPLDDQLRFLVQGYSAVPEPSTALLLCVGLLGIAMHTRRRRSL